MRDETELLRLPPRKLNLDEGWKQKCARCRSEFGRIINRGAVCPCCQQRVCKYCREYNTVGFTSLTNGTEWLCSFCFRNRKDTYDWYVLNIIERNQSENNYFTENGTKSVNSRTSQPGIHRSFTFTDRSSRWAAVRGSPELRAYSSMPRNQTNGARVPKIWLRCSEHFPWFDHTANLKLVDSCGTLVDFPVQKTDNHPDSELLLKIQDFKEIKTDTKKAATFDAPIPAGVTPPRGRRALAGAEKPSCLLQDKEDYRLVFEGSDCSSTCSGDCDWDYFEWGLSGAEATDVAGVEQRSSAARELAPALDRVQSLDRWQPLPIPVPVFVPVPVLLPIPLMRVPGDDAMHLTNPTQVNSTTMNLVSDYNSVIKLSSILFENSENGVNRKHGANNCLTDDDTHSKSNDTDNFENGISEISLENVLGNIDVNGDKIIAVKSLNTSLPNTPYDSIDNEQNYKCDGYASEVEPKVELYEKKGSKVIDDECTINFEDSSNRTEGNTPSDEFSGTESMEHVPLTEIELRKSSNGENDKCLYLNLISVSEYGATDVSFTEDNDTAVSPDTSVGNDIQLNSDKNNLSAVICLEEGLADDDSWVEELDREDLPVTTEESSDNEEMLYADREEDSRYYNRTAIDFTLHTIIEESGEDSESEDEKTNPTQLEKYFVFEIGGETLENLHEIYDDSISETSSVLSESLESTKTGEIAEISKENDPVELASSRLEKYFLSGFMGFNKRDSDGSVGSDSGENQSPEQRRKKFRGRNMGKQLLFSDNIVECEQSKENVESLMKQTNSEYEIEEEYNLFEENDGIFDTVKRIKKKKRCAQSTSNDSLYNDLGEMEIGESNTEIADSNEKQEEPLQETNFEQLSDLVHTKVNTPVIAAELPTKVFEILTKEDIVVPVRKSLLANVVNDGLTRKDSFNNWSSDEETNLMMTKMRAFFKSMIANQKKNSSPSIKNRHKPAQLVYFESELTRLMKTVPGLRDDQVKEIVEYLSSEETWSDSYDSSDYTSSDIDANIQNKLFQNCLNDKLEIDSNISDEIKKDTVLVYHHLMSSFKKTDDSFQSHNSPPLITKVMHHIGTRLVALMHEVSEGVASTPKIGKYHRRLQSKLSTISTTEEEDDSIEEYSPLPRSKSFDPLLEETKLETSDNERFSWRGSFESALMTGADSRSRLPSAGENSASTSALVPPKRRSVGDLLLKSGNNSREHLDRVRSCSSISGHLEDKTWNVRHPRKRRSSVPENGSNSGESADGENDSDDEIEKETSSENYGKSTTLPRALQTTNSSMTNSLPRLSSSASAAVPSIYKSNNSHQFNVKSARYRPPGYNTRNNGLTAATLCAPPRRDHNRRRQTAPLQQIGFATLPAASTIGVGDNCGVRSDNLEMNGMGMNDEEVDKSNFRTSNVSVTRSDSMASVCSGAGDGRYGVVSIRGEVEFGLQYNYKSGDVEIHVKQCRDLAAADTKRNRSDPYVKAYLLPDKSKAGKRKTRVKKHTLNPIFDEILKYHLSLEELEDRTLWLSVWHSDIFGRNDFLGEVIMTLENKVFDDPTPKFYPLQEKSEVLDNVSSQKSELIIALKFIPPTEFQSKKRQNKETGSLHVLVKEAKNLVAVKSNGTLDPFCKSYLLPNKGKNCKQKTPILKRTGHPVWNHTFIYNNVTLEDLPQRCLELTIWDHDRLSSNEFLGGVRLSLGTDLHDVTSSWMNSNHKEISLWQRMIDHPNFWVESSLMLRPLLETRNKG